MAHKRFFLATCKPLKVVLFNKVTVTCIGITALVKEDVMDFGIVSGSEFKIPVDKPTIEGNPLIGSRALVKLEVELPKLLLVVHGAMFALESAALRVLLDSE